MYSLTILGIPTPQKRPRFARMGRYVKTYDTNKSLKEGIIESLATQLPKDLITTPLKVKVCFYFPHIKSHYKSNGALKDKLFYKDTKPDIDNLVKFIFDTLNGVIWRDDALIVSLEASKRFDDRPRTELYIEEIEDDNTKTRS